jgi:hypothetical protein
MSHAMITAVTHILPMTKIRRARMLPASGEILVRMDQKVNATDIVARCMLPGKHMIIDLYRALGISAKIPLEKITDRKAGEKLQKGDVIAQAGKGFKRIVRAPSDCFIVTMAGGNALLELFSPPFELKAGMEGVIREVKPDRGVVIEGSGTLIQGVWGNGQIGSGLLLVPLRKNEDEMTRGWLDVTMRGAIVVGAWCAQEDALQAAAELPLKGLILSSMTADLIPLAKTMPFPIILIEGFGKLPLNSAAFELLKDSEKRDIAINACEWDKYKGERPEIMMAIPGEGGDARAGARLKPGLKVRVTLPPYTSQVGTILQIRTTTATMHSGLRLPSADIQFDEFPTTAIPLVNLDVIE